MKYFAYSQKEFVYKYVVMMSDADQFQHMSFANYLKLMFLATDALFLDCHRKNDEDMHRMRNLSSAMQFKRQSVVGDNILVKVNTANADLAGNIKLLFTFIIEGSAELVGLGKQEYEILDSQANVFSELPQKYADVLKPIIVEEEYLLYKY